jgi:hypothetical protein
VTAEAALWTTLRRGLSPYGVLARVENALGSGTPDVAYCLNGHAGWLELKRLVAWPVRPGTPLRVPHLTAEQVLWLEAWVKARGAAWCLLQVGGTYMLLDPAMTRGVYERRLTQSDLRGGAAVVGGPHLPVDELLRCLTGKPSLKEDVRCLIAP